MKIILVLVLFVYSFISQAYCQSISNRLLQTVSYVTTAQRGRTVTEQCKSTSRQQLYSQYSLDAKIPHGQSVSNFFDLNTTIIDYALSDEWSKVGDQLRRNGGKIFVFVGAWVIGLGIMLILIPFWLCCCICPWNCPIWNRKIDRMPYSQCQLKWPAIAAVILLLIVLVASIVGIASKYKAKANYQQFACSSGVVIDDVNNGNVSYFNPKIFFAGVRTLDTQLRDLNSKIVNLNVQMTKLSSSSTGVVDAKTKITTSKTATAQVPNTNQSSATLTYSTPLQSSTPTSSISSTFPAILGNKSSSSSLVGAAYNSLVLYQTKLTVMSTAADSYLVNAPSYTASIENATKQTNKTATTIQNKDKQINDFFNKNQSSVNGISIGEYVLYGLLIGFMVLTIFAVLCTVWGKSDKCRGFMYFLAFILVILCTASFLYCIFAGLANPVAYYTCQYIEQNLSNKTKLYETLTKRLAIDSTSAANISECIASDGSGEIASSLLGTSVFSTLTSLNTSYLSLAELNTSAISSIISTTHATLRDTVTAYKTAQKNDINDQTSLNELIKLSQASNYTCSSTGFTSDSWIPSISQNPIYVSCKVNNGIDVDSSTCTNSASFNAKSTGCVGCMDTYDLFKSNTTVSNVKSALDSRYSDPSCSTFNTQLSNVWGNFYKKKLDTIGPIQTRASNAKSQSDIVVATIPYFNQVQQSIDSQFSSVVNSQYGILSGLNCKIIGQDVRLMRTVFCENIFLYTYFVRVIFGIISFALLFALCCITCTGHRNSKQQQFQSKKYNDQGVPNNLNNQRNQQQYAKYNIPSSQGFIQMNTRNPPIDGNDYKFPYFKSDNQKNPYQMKKKG